MRTTQVAPTVDNFLDASGPVQPRATAIIIGGGDLTAEELYFCRRGGLPAGLQRVSRGAPGQKRGAYYSDPDLKGSVRMSPFRMGLHRDTRWRGPTWIPSVCRWTGYSMGGLFAPTGRCPSTRQRPVGTTDHPCCSRSAPDAGSLRPAPARIRRVAL